MSDSRGQSGFPRATSTASASRGRNSVTAASEQALTTLPGRNTVGPRCSSTGYGWVPADPADVRKVVLEEKPQPTTLADPLVPPVRRKLFGSWEMNWVGFNNAHDVRLPNSKGDKIAFFMYPQLETANGRADSLDPDNFKYTITAREIKA